MAKLLMLQGLPGSGKTTFARELVAKGGWTRINNDDLRESFHNGKWSKHNEKLITLVREATVGIAMGSGFNVVADNLNLHPKHEKSLREFAKNTGATFEKKFFDTPVEECIKRDLLRERSVGRDVIMSWYNDYLKPAPEVYTPPTDKPQAIIVDIDGTLAHMDGRSPYDPSKYHEDLIDEVIKGMVRTYYIENSYTVIICSGRDGTYRDVTEAWLATHNIPHNLLLMRQANDKRKDSIIKRELFDNYIRDNFNVKFVLDDRNQVVEMWRSLGLKCLQVAEGAF